MRDVAALAGVSPKTVSRVVNHEAGVSGELAERVRKATVQLGYRHNLAASNLRRGERTLSVALLVQDLSNDYSAAMMRAVDDEVRSSGVALLSASLDEEEARERDIVGNLIGRRVDGLIMMPASQSQAYLQDDVAAGFAVVMVDRPPRHLLVDYVVADNVGGGRQATAHLLAHGHRRIALVSDEPAIPTAAQRRTGYVEALRDAGLPVDESLMRSARTEEASRQAVLDLLDSAEPPTALFAARNTAAVGAVRALKERGLQHQVALVGFDELRWADLVEPGVSTVAQNPALEGREAARMLLARLAGSTAEPAGRVLSTTLIARGSGELPLR